MYFSMQPAGVGSVANRVAVPLGLTLSTLPVQYSVTSRPPGSAAMPIGPGTVASDEEAGSAASAAWPLQSSMGRPASGASRVSRRPRLVMAPTSRRNQRQHDGWSLHGSPPMAFPVLMHLLESSQP